MLEIQEYLGCDLISDTFGSLILSMGPRLGTSASAELGLNEFGLLSAKENVERFLQLYNDQPYDAVEPIDGDDELRLLEVFKVSLVDN